MKRKGDKPKPGSGLRRLAEDRLRARQGGAPGVDAAPDRERLIHELQVHQVELEIQNEELRRARDELEVTVARWTELYDFAPVGYVTLDDKSTILEINLVGAAMLGKERSRVIGHRFALGVTAATRPTFDAFLATLGGKDKASCDVALVNRGGRDLSVHVDGVRERDGQKTDWRCRAALTDVTERKAAEELLRAEDRQKSEFLAVLSHELRNPLAPIRNSLHVLERAQPGSDLARHATAVLRRQTEHLTRLVDDLLDVTRISRGKMELNRETLDAREVIRRTRDDHLSIFEQRGIQLRLEEPAGPVWIEADAARLSQVLGNLLHNAAKFTPHGGSALVTVDAEHGQAVVRVRDTGIGMEPDQVERMFEPFVQAANTLARTQGGLGLGLALVKGLVELHGGTVSATSVGLGSGSDFVIRFPLAAPPPRPVAAAHAVPGEPGRLVLVIDDNIDAAQSLADILHLEGHRVRVGHDGQTGIALAHELKPDLVICDIGLPDVNGYDVARALRSDESLRRTRLVALTGYARPEDRERAKEAGFDAHLPKPVPLSRLLDLLVALRSSA